MVAVMDTDAKLQLLQMRRELTALDQPTGTVRIALDFLNEAIDRPDSLRMPSVGVHATRARSEFEGQIDRGVMAINSRTGGRDYAAITALEALAGDISLKDASFRFQVGIQDASRAA